MAISLALVAVLALAACDDDEDDGGDAAPTPADGEAPTGEVAVTLNDFAVIPDQTSVSAGSVTFDAINDGPSPHELVVVTLGEGQTSDPATGDLPIGEAGDFEGRVDEDALEAEDSLLGAIEEEDLPDGASASLTLTLEAGDHALICNIPGHYAAGMWADFTVE
ncbi:MAG: sulfocyanin-like copper-binding protein [Dehalococcoidia bacterium]